MSDQPQTLNEIKELTKAIKKSNSYNSPLQFALRSFVNGIVFGLGTTLGFGFVIVILSSIVSVTGDIPLISNILEATRLDIIIDNQIKEIESGNGNENDTQKFEDDNGNTDTGSGSQTTTGTITQ